RPWPPCRSSRTRSTTPSRPSSGPTTAAGRAGSWWWWWVPRRCSSGQGRTSEVDHVAGDALDRFLDRLGERRVGEDVAGDLVGGEVPPLGERQHRQQLGDVGTDHVGAEDLVVLRVG